MSLISEDIQLSNYQKGFPFLTIKAPATPEKGITIFDNKEQNTYQKLYESFEGKVVKFVPASGAASRMFKDLFQAKETLVNSDKPIAELFSEGTPAARFFDRITNFPFYTSELFEGKTPLEILDTVLGEKGLNYGSLPKGQILFHKYSGSTSSNVLGQTFPLPAEIRTAFEEHLVEGALYAQSKSESGNIVHLHFTVSPEHLNGFEMLFASVKNKYEQRFGCRYDVAFSTQSPETNMIAVNEDNTPFVKKDGTVLYRPGGHGALLQNLGSIDAEIIIVKNIDNIIRQEMISETVRWKMILAGKLLQTREMAYDYLRRLEVYIGGIAPSCAACPSNATCPGAPTGDCSMAGSSSIKRPSTFDKGSLNLLCKLIIEFIEKEFCITIPDIPEKLLPHYLYAKLNRPIRVCGMVKNEGEPGGGPFIVLDDDGSTSLQILESAQFDSSDPKTALLIKESTHFNPVDIVCCTENYKGERFDLQKFVDPQTGLISSKSYEGRLLKAQELPGLWNGSMSNWNTIFVETPLITFNPVKTILDLLRKEHSVTE